MKKLFSGIALLFGAVVANASTITSVPDATIFIDSGLVGGYFGPFMPGPFDATGTTGITSGTSQSLSFTYRDGAASASFSASAAPGRDTDGDAYVEFSFAVSGPSDVAVPLVFNASGNLSLTVNEPAQDRSASSVTAYASVTGLSVYNFNYPQFQGAQYYVSGSQSLGGSQNGLSIVANTVGTVMLFVSGEAEIGNVVGGSATYSAFVDPQLSIDPGFSLAGYSLIFSPDAAPPVQGLPEPTTPLLLLARLPLAMLIRRTSTVSARH